MLCLLYFVVPNHVFYFAYMPPPGYPDIPPPFTSPPKTLYEVVLTQGFNVGFYGIHYKILVSVKWGRLIDGRLLFEEIRSL